MAPRSTRGGPGEALRRRTRLTLGLLTAVWAALLSAGAVYSVQRQAELRRLVAARVLTVAHGIEQLFEAMRLRALLAGARDRLDAREALQTESPSFRLWLLRREAQGYRVERSISASGASSDADHGRLIQSEAISVSGDATRLVLWPPASPEFIAMCAAADDGRIACATLTAAGLSNFISESAVQFEHELRIEGGPIAQTVGFPAWGSARNYASTAPVNVEGAKLELTAGPSDELVPAFALHTGYYFAIGVSVLYALALMLALSRQRNIAGQLALQHAIEQAHSQGEDLVRTTLRSTSSAADVLVWLLHEDERLELIGPGWADIGLSEGMTQLSEATKVLDDGSVVRAGLRDSMRTRSAWSRLLTMTVDGEKLTFQANCAPLFGSDGRFLAMLGVTSDITGALSQAAQRTKDEAFRTAQTSYLRHMAKEVSGPAMHVQAVVDLLSRQVSEGDANQQRLLKTAADEARRLFDVVRGSLELMNLRNTNVQDQLKPLQLDLLVEEVARTVASKEGSKRRQQLDYDSSTDALVLAHKQSLITILTVVLSNAFRYSPEDAVVRVRVRRTESSVVVDIDDGGPGMKPEELAHLGEPFFRGVASIGTSGSGLGVATAYELANHTRSSLSFRNCDEEERGLLVTITLPLAA